MKLADYIERMEPKWLWIVVVLSVWVLEAGLSNGCGGKERLALLQLKPFFTHLKDEESSDCCQWEWVGCNNTTKQVTELFLNYTNRRSNSAEKWYLNASLFLPFEELRNLYLNGNQIAGCVENEDFGKLSTLRQLEILDLSHNYFNERSTLFSSLRSGKQSMLMNLEVLDLSYNFFNNSILAELSGISNLKSLDVSFNQMKGSIDIKEFCTLSNLESLDMSWNEMNQFVTSKENKCLRKLKNLYLDGVSTKQSISLVSLLEPFPSVKTLFLRNNSYINKRVVTQELQVLSNVEDLIMDNTPLSIDFLRSIGSLTSLKTLSLSNCNLTGTLPAQGWCDLKSLEELRLNGNGLHGAIASCLGNLTFLRFLDISNNQFKGNIASSPLTNLTMLQYLSLSNNQIKVPLSFKSFANHSDLKFLLSDGNKLVAEQDFHIWSPKFQLKVFSLANGIEHRIQLPEFLYYQHDLRYINISNINFRGIGFPSWLLENNTRLEALYMIDSSIVGPLFLPSHPNSNMRVIDISKNRVQRQVQTNFCSIFPNLEGLFMSQNLFESNIPRCLGGMRYLTHLDMSHNHFFGEIPEELVVGRSLQFLRLSNNFLSGKMFPAIYRSDFLKGLYLDGNNFDDDLPKFSPISSLVLEILDLSDNHLSGELPRWLWNNTKLKILTLAKNQFWGPIPVELCNMVNLEVLDLSHNNLTGTIPPCSSLQYLKRVHLGWNKLSGPMSSAYFGSSSLLTLDLSKNNLSGNIPDSIGTLHALRFLLLKGNHFHGEFPIQLCKLHSLRVLDLSQNELSGPIASCLSNLTHMQRFESSDGSMVYYFEFNMFDRVLADMILKIYDRALADMRLKIYDLMRNEEEYSANGFPILCFYPYIHVEEELVIQIKGFLLNFRRIVNIFSAIDLSDNQLTGLIPFELGNLRVVRSLNLSHNNLTGPIPSTFSNLLDMESLDLSYNNLNGGIPPQLTEMSFLELFNVVHNNLSGPIPGGKQFDTFTNDSYEGNPLLCGRPLQKSCSESESDSPETPNASSNILDFKFKLSMYSFQLLLLLLYFDPDIL